ncbi:MAG: insulinase family protein [Opitutae bacterium]|nr:insulinase family protein [Opitutae bacterium]
MTTNPAASFLPPAQTVLANGMRVAFAKTFPSGLVSVQIWVKTGSIHEGKYLGAGISHFLEHMVFKGSKEQSAEFLAKKIQAAGGVSNAYTTFERTVYHVDVPSEKIEVAFAALAEMLVRPALAAAEVARERNVILREMDMGKDEPDRVLNEATFAEIFREHPYRIPVIGRRELLEKLTAENLRDYFERRYTPETMSVIVAGDVEKAEVFALSEKYFGIVARRNPDVAAIPAEPPQLAKREVRLAGDTNVLRGNVVWKIPGMAHDDTPALAVLTGILGSGDSAILYRELHEKREIVHGIGAFAWTPGSAGLCWVGYQADCGKAPAVEAAIFEILDKIATKGLPEKLIKKVARKQIVALINSQQTVAAAAARLGNEVVVLGDPGATKAFIDATTTITSDDLQRVATKYFRDKGLTVSSFEKVATTNPRQSRHHQPATTNGNAFENFTLKNGIRVLLQSDNSLPKIHLRATMLAGGAYENERSRGATAMLATLLGLDTQTRSAATVAETIESLGGIFYNDSGNNTLTLATETLAEDFETACEIVSDAIQRPKFSQKNFARERDTQLSALNSELDEAVDFATIKLFEKFFGKHFLATHIFGTEKTLTTMTLADVQALQKRLIVPQNIVISAAGDFDTKRVLASIKRRFEKMPAAKKWTRARSDFAKPATTGSVFVPRKSEQTIVLLAFSVPGVSDKRQRIPDILLEIFNGMGSHIFSEVREKRGLAYFVAASQTLTPDTGIFYFYAGTKREHASEVLEKMREEISRIRAGKISDKELSAAKIRAKTKKRTARQSLAARTLEAALNALYDLPQETPEAAEARLDSVSASDIAKFAQEFFPDENSLAMTVGPNATAATKKN